MGKIGGWFQNMVEPVLGDVKAPKVKKPKQGRPNPMSTTPNPKDGTDSAGD